MTAVSIIMSEMNWTSNISKQGCPVENLLKLLSWKQEAFGELGSSIRPLCPSPSPSPPLRWQNSSQQPVPPIHNPTPMVLYHLSTNKSIWETLEQPFVAKAHWSLLFTESTHYKCTQLLPSTWGPQVPEKGSIMASETKRPSKLEKIKGLVSSPLSLAAAHWGLCLLFSQNDSLHSTVLVCTQQQPLGRISSIHQAQVGLFSCFVRAKKNFVSLAVLFILITYTLHLWRVKKLPSEYALTCVTPGGQWYAPLYDNCFVCLLQELRADVEAI